MNNKKKYIKPTMDELSDVNMTLLAGSQLGTDIIGSRQQDNVFAEDDDDNDELF